MRVLIAVILSIAVAVPRAIAEPPTLRDRLASDDAAVREKVVGELLEQWEELTDAALAELGQLRSDDDAEVSAAAQRVEALVRARRTFGPWLADRAVALDVDIKAGRTTLERELEWAAAEWIQGRASDKELENFLDRAWGVGKAYPPFGVELQRATWHVRPYGKMFEAWLAACPPTDPNLEGRLSSLRSCDDVSRARCLVPFLESKDDKIRYAALDGLKVLGARETASAVAELLDDPEVRIRRTAVETLVSFDARSHVEAVRERLQDAEYVVVDAALDCLGRWKDLDSAAAIKSLAQDPYHLYAAAECLGRLGRLLPEPARRQALWLRDWDSEEVLRSIFGDRLTPKDRKMLLHVAVSGEEARRKRALQLLPKLLTSEDLMDLRLWVVEQPVETRRALVVCFERLPLRERIDFYRPLLADDDAYVRGLAAFGVHVDRTSSSEIVRLLDSRNEQTMHQACLALAWQGSTEAAPRLAGMLGESESRQRLALRYANWLDLREWTPELRRIAATGDRWNANRARDILMDWSGAEDADWLVSLLSTDDSSLRWRVCRRLVELGHLGRVRSGLADFRDEDGLVPESLLVSLLECRDAQAAELVMEQPAWLDTGRSWAAFRKPWMWAMSHVSPQAFEAMPAPLRKSALRRLRNLRTSPHLDVEMQADIALARVGALMPKELSAIFEKTQSDEPYMVRLSLTRRGYSYDVYEALNAATEPESWRRIHIPFTTAKAIVTPTDLALAVRQASLEFDAGSAVTMMRTAPGVRTTLLALLERHLTGEATWVLDGKTIRLVTWKEVPAWWRKRLSR